MGKTLIITEKPSVAREYADILGVPKRGQGAYNNNDYIITWCVTFDRDELSRKV